MRRSLTAPFGDMRSGLFVAMAEWAAKKVHDLAASRERTWKANLLMAVEDVDVLKRHFDFILNIVQPKGFIKVVGLTGRTDEERLFAGLPDLTQEFSRKGVFASWTVISAASFGENLKAGIETFGGAFFKPNLLFLTLPEEEERDEELAEIIKTSISNRIGVLLLSGESMAGLGKPDWLNVWFHDRGPDWEVSMDLGNQDLALLIGYKLKVNWRARLRLVASVPEAEQDGAATQFLRSVADMARIPVDEFTTQWAEADTPLKSVRSDISIIPMPESPDFQFLRRISSNVGTPCVFTRDSGDKNVLA